MTNEIKIKLSVDGAPAASSAVTGVGKSFDGLGAAADKATASAARVNAALARSADKAAVSAGQTAAAWRQLPMQLQDVAVSLQGGMSPFTVLMQQGPQITSAFGGVRATIAAMGSAVGPVGAAVGVMAAAFGATAIAAYQGSREMSALSSALINNGNQIGMTSGQLSVMAARLDGVAGITRGSATEALATLSVAAGVTAENIERITATALRLEAAGGPAVTETAQQFSELAKAPLAASVKLNEQYGHLTAAVYRQIKALEEQGKTTEAAKLAQEAFLAASEGRLPELARNLGTLERAWKGVTGAVSEAWDAIKGVGRADAAEDRIAAAQKRVDELRARAAKGGGMYGPQLTMTDSGLRNVSDVLRETEADLERMKAAKAFDDTLAAQQKRSADATKALVAWDKQGSEYLSNQARMAQEVARARELGAAAGVKGAELEARIAAIRDKYKEKPKAGNDGSALALAEARAASAATLDALKTEMAKLDAMRASGVLSADSYETQKTAIQRREVEARIALIEREIAIESGRKGGAANAAGLRGQLATARGDLGRLDVAAQAGADARALEDSRRAAEEWARTWQSAADQTRQLADQTMQSLDALITDPAERARREAERDVAAVIRNAAELRRTLATRIDTLSGQAGGADLVGPLTDQQRAAVAQAEALARQRDALDAEVTRSIAARNDRLVEDLKPGWQKMVEGWRDAQRLMRDAADETMERLVKGGEDAFAELAKTGKLNVQSLLKDLQGQAGRLVWRQLAGSEQGQKGLSAVSDWLNGLSVKGYSGKEGDANFMGPLPEATDGAASSMEATAKAADKLAGAADNASAASNLQAAAAAANALGMGELGQVVSMTSMAMTLLELATKAAAAMKLATAGSAVGHVFTGVQRFAAGGAFTNRIVTSPTLFRFAHGGRMRLGEMGEAGPEAVMPLEGGHKVTALDGAGRRVGALQLGRGPGGRLAVVLQDAAQGVVRYAAGGAFSAALAAPVPRFALGGAFASGGALASAATRAAAPGRSSGGLTVNMVANVPAGASRSEVLLAMQQARREAVAEMQNVMRRNRAEYRS